MKNFNIKHKKTIKKVQLFDLKEYFLFVILEIK